MGYRQGKEMTNDNRILWIDFAKSVSAAAVVVQHTFGIFYWNPVLRLSCYLAVPVFILLSGITA